MDNLYNRIHSLVLDKGMTDGSACAAVGLPRSTLGSLKTGKTKSLSQKNLKLFAELLNVTVDKLVNSEDSVDDLAAGVPLAMYGGDKYEQVPEDIKQLAAAFALAKKEQEIKDPALRKIIEVCKPFIRTKREKHENTIIKRIFVLFSFVFNIAKHCKTRQKLD